MKHLRHLLSLFLTLFFLVGCTGKLHDIVINGSTEELKKEITTKESLQEAFSWATYYGKINKMRYLLDNGADVNYYAQDLTFGLYPALRLAVINNQLQAVQLLVQNGASFQNYSVTAAWNRHYDILRYLVAQGADIHTANHGGQTAFNILKSQNQTALIQELLQIQQKKKLEKQKQLEKEKKVAELKKQKEQIALYIQEQNFEELKVYVERYPNTANLIPQPELRLALTGPKDLKVGDIRKLIQKGMDEKIILSLIKRVKVPYKEFTLEEIDLIIEMGISSNIIATMIDVTTELLKDQERKKEQEFFLKEQAKMAKQGRSTTQVIYQQGQGKDVVDVITEEATKQGIKMLLDHLF